MAWVTEHTPPVALVQTLRSMATPVGVLVPTAAPDLPVGCAAPSNVGDVEEVPRLTYCTVSVPASVIAAKFRMGSMAMALGKVPAPRASGVGESFMQAALPVGHSWK